MHFMEAVRAERVSELVRELRELDGLDTRYVPVRRELRELERIEAAAARVSVSRIVADYGYGL